MTDVEFFIITGTSITLLFIAFILSFLFINQKKHFTYQKEKKDAENKFSQTILQSQLEIQEQTLQHISKELHDNMGQIASLIKINLHTIALDNKEKATQKLEDTRELTKQLIIDIKSLSVSLGADRITQTGLDKALETEIERINKTEQFTATYEQEGNMPAMDNDKAIILYRMAQEVLNNMVKHSEAKHIALKLFANENLIILALSDDGKGFDAEDKIRNGSGAGLHNLQKRANLLQATLTMQSSIGNGTQVTIELPYSYAPNTASNTSTG